MYILLISLLFLCAGCNGESEAVQNNGAKVRILEGSSKIYEKEESIADELEKNNSISREKAEALIDAVTEIEGIEEASAVVYGSAAIIGISIEGELTDEKLIALKNLAEEKAKETDQGIKFVAVTAADDLIEQITEISDLEDNNISGYDIQSIFHRIAPTI